MLYLICYDIVSNKRRKKVSDVLLDHGIRVQKSAFECDMKSEARLAVLLQQIRVLLDEKTDTVRAYRVCASCLQSRRLIGIDKAPLPPDSTIIL